MPRFEDLKLETGDVITTDWYDKLISHLESLNGKIVTSPQGYVYTNLAPVQDLALNLGLENYRWLTLHAYTIYYHTLVAV